MIKICLASVLGFILIYIESLIAMQLKGSTAIEFSGIAPFISVWAMNFFFVFSFLTQAAHWFQMRFNLGNGDEKNIF